MNGWSFSIAAGADLSMLSLVVESIRSEMRHSENYEILIVGDSNRIHQFAANDVKLIEFDESIKPGWITRKKNLISQHSKFDKISMHHDYISLMDGWYRNFEKFGDDWDVSMTRVENGDGSRFRDWVSWYDNHGEDTIKYLRYDDHSQTNKMYVSGSYFCAKKKFMLAHPFDENLTWGQGEDVEWSKSVRDSWKYRMNFHSRVRSLKMKHKWPVHDPFEAWYLERKETI